MSTVESQATAVYKSVPGRQELGWWFRGSAELARGGACLNTTQPPKCCDKCCDKCRPNRSQTEPQSDRTAVRPNRGQGRRCAAPKPSARCAFCAACAGCECAVFTVCSSTFTPQPPARAHPNYTPLRTPWPERPQRQVKVTSGVCGDVEALSTLGASRGHP